MAKRQCCRCVHGIEADFNSINELIIYCELTADEVPEGHQFYHCLIDGAVYAGVFVGKENAE